MKGWDCKEKRKIGPLEMRVQIFDLNTRRKVFPAQKQIIKQRILIYFIFRSNDFFL